MKTAMLVVLGQFSRSWRCLCCFSSASPSGRHSWSSCSSSRAPRPSCWSWARCRITPAGIRQVVWRRRRSGAAETRDRDRLTRRATRARRERRRSHGCEPARITRVGQSRPTPSTSIASMSPTRTGRKPTSAISCSTPASLGPHQKRSRQPRPHRWVGEHLEAERVERACESRAPGRTGRTRSARCRRSAPTSLVASMTRRPFSASRCAATSSGTAAPGIASSTRSASAIASAIPIVPGGCGDREAWFTS